MFCEASRNGTLLRLSVMASAKKFSVRICEGFLKTEVKAKPEMGKANLEIEKEFGKILGKKARITAGWKSRRKLLFVEEVPEKVLQALKAIA